MKYSSIDVLMQQIRDWAEEEDYDAIIKVLPELETPGQYYEAVLSIACVYLNQGMYKDAERWLREVEEQGQESGEWNYRLAVALMHQMNLDDALPYAENAIRVAADYPWGWAVYSKLMYGHDEKEKALEAAKKALELMPGDAELLALLDDLSNDLPFAEITGIDPEDADEELFYGAVLLNSVEIDMDRIASDFKEDWGIELDEFREIPLNTREKEFFVEDATVKIYFIPERFFEDDMEELAASNYFWEDAVEVTKTQKAHLVIAVRYYEMTRIEAGKLFVKVVSSCLKQPNAIGVCTSGGVFQPEFYIEVADGMKVEKDYLPVMDWVFVSNRKYKGKNNVYTCGLTSLGKDEMEILECNLDFDFLSCLMMMIVHLVLKQDSLQDLGVIDLGEGNVFSLKRSKGVNVMGMSRKISLLSSRTQDWKS